MKKVSKIAIICLLLVFSMSLIVGAQPQSIPNGPWLQSNQKVMLSSLIKPEEVGERLFQIERRARAGRMSVEIIGESAGYNWPIYVAKFGEPDENKVNILIDTQIHGNEPLGTEAALNLIQTLAMSNNPEVRNILDKVTVWIVPMLNPGGATVFEIKDFEYFGFSFPDGWYQSRQNIQHWTPSDWGLPVGTRSPWYWSSLTLRDFDLEGKYRGIGGYDINRDSHPYLDFDLTDHAHLHHPNDTDANNAGQPGFLVTPEARALRNLFKELQPDVYINHHHRGTNLVSEDDNRMCTLQILAQVVPLEEEYILGDMTWTLSEESLELSKQMNYLVFDALQKGGKSPFSSITQYPVVKDYSGGRGLPGTTLGSFSLNGAAIMLYEVRSSGQKSSGMLIQQSYIGLYETLRGFATGEVYEIDPDLYDDIPPSGPRISVP